MNGFPPGFDPEDHPSDLVEEHKKRMQAKAEEFLNVIHNGISRAESAEAINEQLQVRNAELAIEAEMLRQQINDLKQHIAKEPFYWTRPEGYPAEQCAEEGWYQWTRRGLVYLGTTADLTLDDIDVAAAAMLDRAEAENGKLVLQITGLRTALLAAIRALQSYEYGNQSPELAKEVVEKLQEILEDEP
jgi:phage-related protein